MKTKNFVNGLLAAALVLLPACSAIAQTDNKYTSFSSGGTAVSTTLSYAVVSADSKNLGTPVVTYVNASSDKAGAVVQFYNVTTNTAANYASSGVSIPVNYTNSFASGDIIVIRHLANDVYERRVLTAFLSSTNLTVTSAPTTALAVGDLVYRCTAGGKIPVPTNTIVASSLLLTQAGQAIYSGQKGSPLLLEVDGTSAESLNSVTAEYR